MAARTVLATLPGSAPCRRLEVALVQARDGRATIELCEQNHAPGLGWFGQRSLTLDPQQWRQLQAVLGGKAPVDFAPEAPRGDVLPFPAPTPAPRDAGPGRSAVGGAG